MLQKYIKLSVLLMLCGCKTDAFEFSDVPALSQSGPVLQFKLNGKDSLVRISIKYTDGDGDIGLEPSDTLAPFNFGSPYFYNLYIYVYTVDNGISKPLLIPSGTDTVNYNDRIGTLTPSGKQKAISGDISINLKAEPYPGLKPDSMFYTIQIADRKLNKSNILKTEVMAFEF